MQTIIRSNTKTLTFQIYGNYSAKLIEFAIKKDTDIESDILVKKSSLSSSELAMTYNSASNETTILVYLLEEDTSDLETGAYVFDLTSITDGRETILASNVIIIQGDVNNPLSGVSTATLGQRIISVKASDFDEGDYLKVVVVDGIKSFAKGQISVDLSDKYSKATDLNLMLKAWAESESFQILSATRDTNGNITSGSVKWPDGQTGTYTATNYNNTHYTYDGFTVTYPGKTITQSAVTRDSNGCITIKPELIIG